MDNTFLNFEDKEYEEQTGMVKSIPSYVESQIQSTNYSKIGNNGFTGLRSAQFDFLLQDKTLTDTTQNKYYKKSGNPYTTGTFGK